MCMLAISHHIDAETGISQLTYDQLTDVAFLSRAKVAAGLEILVKRELIARLPANRSSFQLSNYNPASGWAMLPARGLYSKDVISAFSEFKLRRRVELDALKLYFLFTSRRSRELNAALISYEKIEFFAAVGHDYIRPALTVLAVNGLVHVDRIPSEVSEYGTANAYRLAHLETRVHAGTTARDAMAAGLKEVA